MGSDSLLVFSQLKACSKKRIVKVGTRCYNNLIIVILERLDMSTISYKPLNLYRQFKTAAQEFPNVAIYFDQPYASFP